MPARSWRLAIRRWVLACCLLHVVSFPAAAQAPLRVRYPAAESATDARQAYPKAVLALALQRADVPVELGASSLPANQQRALRLLAAGDIDVAWSVATDARQRELRAIPVAIDRGMFGWRVLLVRREGAPRFAAIRDLAGLSHMRGAQGADWPDLTVLRDAGLRVDAVHTYEGLFAMLARGRIDYVPRSVLEIGDELARRPRDGLAIESTLLLRYPSALYFYVRRDNAALANALQHGLAVAAADGSLDRLFHATFDEVLAPLNLPDRAVLDLENPTWTASQPEH